MHTPTLTPTDDYTRIAQVIAYLETHVDTQPTLADIAAHVHLSEYHLQRLFTRWAGVSPKRFLQILTAERARTHLTDQQPVLHTAIASGLSSPGRLHDLMVTLHAVTPGDVQRAGHGLTLRYGLHDSPFGRALLLTSDRGIVGLDFPDGLATPTSDFVTQLDLALARHRRLWADATIIEDPTAQTDLVRAIFTATPRPGQPLALYVRGTNWQVKVWQALLQIPPGHTTTYGEIARAVCTSRASRAVGAAVGANPISWLIPCHRVIRQGGALGGYHWGLPRKHAMQLWEHTHHSI